MVAWCVLVCGFMSFHLARLNARRERGEEDDKVAGMSSEEIDELGDASPKFRYTI